MIMGSGETSPTMVTPHQQIISNLAGNPNPVLNILDTPFGFQENADLLTAKITEYFANSVGAKVGTVSLKDSSPSGDQLGVAVNSIRNSDWLFAGPGSPSYALKVWKNLGITPSFDEILSRGALVFASAGALAVGSFTIPIYEIYRVGQEPYWLDGLNLLERHTGMRASIIPHFDNTEGANHDTRYCYMGERRLQILEKLLPDDNFIIGIDEHTGVSFDLDLKIAKVFGRGQMTIRHHGQSWIVKNGQTATFEEIVSHANSKISNGPSINKLKVDPTQIEDLLASGEVSQAVASILNLDELDRNAETRAVVHSLVSKLGTIAASPQVDLNLVISPFVAILLQLRDAARLSERWADADAIRDWLLEMKITITDSKTGTTWKMDI